MDSVIVFGDSLSDIGKKWLTKSGRLAKFTNQMHTSPTGRFSDCRNWTDFMYEAATGDSLLTGTAAEAVAKSADHTSYSKECAAFGFQYANYAEGGACGDRPASKALFLGTFKDQIDSFEADCKSSGLPLGNALFIVWFGANDLYTAKRVPGQMDQVAREIAKTQRDRLAKIFDEWNMATAPLEGPYTCKFIFADLCRPLSSVRYSMSLKKAEDKVIAHMGKKYSKEQAKHNQSLSNAENTLEQAGWQGKLPNRFGRANAEEKLRRQIESIKSFEEGVRFFNQTLASIASGNGDLVAKLANCLSEDTIEQLLIRRDYGLKFGAMDEEAAFVSAPKYDENNQPHTLTTIDEAHPTDQMYRLIWWEIFEQIKAADCTFGKLSPAGPASPTLGDLTAHTELMKQIKEGPKRRLRTYTSPYTNA
ncbi:MAG: hypothetical protein JOY64_10985 [Alphaproteobacteria bacterium]|nr:hypothetical protein [Alphaproteobacteria bacterium]